MSTDKDILIVNRRYHDIAFLGGVPDTPFSRFFTPQHPDLSDFLLNLEFSKYRKGEVYAEEKKE